MKQAVNFLSNHPQSVSYNRVQFFLVVQAFVVICFFITLLTLTIKSHLVEGQLKAALDTNQGIKTASLQVLQNMQISAIDEASLKLKQLKQDNEQKRALLLQLTQTKHSAIAKILTNLRDSMLVGGHLSAFDIVDNELINYQASATDPQLIPQILKRLHQYQLVDRNTSGSVQIKASTSGEHAMQLRIHLE